MNVISRIYRIFPSQIVSDMRGNSSRLLVYYQKDEMCHRFIEDMILKDNDRTTHSWLLWLKRALEMMERFFWLVLNDDEVIKEKSDSIRPQISQAYDEVLRPYHGFFLQKASKVSFDRQVLNCKSLSCF